SRAALEAAQANLKSTQADLERAKVDAEGPDVPLLKRAYDRANGMAKDDAVSSILVLGSSATLVMTLGDTSEVYVKGKVDESDIGKVYLGQPARIKVESFKE